MMRKSKYGIFGIISGSAALLLALIHFWAGPFSPQPTLETIVAQKAASICTATLDAMRAERLANRKLITNSRVAALALDGSHIVADENVCDVPTPYGLNVITPRLGRSTKNLDRQQRSGQFPLDREVIQYLVRYFNSAPAKEPAAN